VAQVRAELITLHAQNRILSLPGALKVMRRHVPYVATVLAHFATQALAQSSLANSVAQ